MAYTTVNKSTDYFNTLLHTGNDASPRSLTGVGFQPDFVWLKRRNDASSHTLYDAVRTAGSTKGLHLILVQPKVYQLQKEQQQIMDILTLLIVMVFL